MRLVLVGVVACACLVGSVQAQEGITDAHIKQYIAEREQGRQKAIDYQTQEIPKLKSMLAAAKRGRIDGSRSGTLKHSNGNYTFPSKSQKDREIASITEKIASTETRLATYKHDPNAYAPRLDRIALGSIGQWPGANILQVVDEKTALVNFSSVQSKQTVWITGISTAGMVDGGAHRADVIVAVTGTKTYTTAVGGSRTVFTVEPLDLSRLPK